MGDLMALNSASRAWQGAGNDKLPLPQRNWQWMGDNAANSSTQVLDGAQPEFDASDRKLIPNVVLDQSMAPGIRGFVLRSPYRPFSMHAFLGVPADHWAAGAQSVIFQCKGGITLRLQGDGLRLPASWYWFGWSYVRPGDTFSLLPGVQRNGAGNGVVVDAWSDPKGCTLTEVKQDLAEAAAQLATLLRRGQSELCTRRIASRAKSSERSRQPA
jgi:hypothetical protein